MTGKVEKIEQTKEMAPRNTAMITPIDMISQGISSGASVEVIERLLALQERWEANQAKKAFDAAMAALRDDLPKIAKSRTVDYTPNGKPRVNYQYEDLSDVTKALGPAMTKCGLSFRWRTDYAKDEGISVTCVIAHKDGHSEETTLRAAPDVTGGKNAIQAIGSAVTYLQRYTLKAAIGVAAEGDDDGIGINPNAIPDENRARAVLTQAIHEIGQAKDKTDLKDIWDKIDWPAIPDDWHEEIINTKDARLRQLASPKGQFDAMDKQPDNTFPGDK